MKRAERIKHQLEYMFTPLSLVVKDDSAQHAGHRNAPDGGESHYTVEIVSAAFSELSRVARHRLVNEALKSEFESGLHALSIIAQSPEEVGL